MNENIQVTNKAGETIVVEGISFIELTEANKKYVFYTLNEKVDNDLTKIYIAEVSDSDEESGSISDAEWDDLRKKMVRISHKEELTDVKYLSMTDQTFKIGDPRKLAVSAVNMQAFKDYQITHTISVNQTDTPVEGTPTFFAQELAPATVETAPSDESIFTNPPQPVENVDTEPESVDSVPTEQPVIDAQPVVEPQLDAQSQVIENTNENVVTQSEFPATEPVVQESVPVQEIAPVQEQPVIETVAQSAPTDAALDVGPAVIAEPVAQTEMAESPDVEPVEPVEQVVPTEVTSPVENVPIIDTTTITNGNEQKAIISDEDALKAISVIQDYIDQEEAA
ncbi:MAG: hypothetical protein J1F35_07315 [Erysipelotrichales bacterium]|nr:hypothetical protein [Erysipelotrichales bacterium]